MQILSHHPLLRSIDFFFEISLLLVQELSAVKKPPVWKTFPEGPLPWKACLLVLHSGSYRLSRHTCKKSRREQQWRHLSCTTHPLSFPQFHLLKQPAACSSLLSLPRLLSMRSPRTCISLDYLQKNYQMNIRKGVTAWMKFNFLICLFPFGFGVHIFKQLVWRCLCWWNILLDII